MSMFICLLFDIFKEISFIKFIYLNSMHDFIKDSKKHAIPETFCFLPYSSCLFVQMSFLNAYFLDML